MLDGKDGSVNSQLPTSSLVSKLTYDLSTNGIDNTVRANRDLFVYDTEKKECHVTHLEPIIYTNQKIDLNEENAENNSESTESAENATDNNNTENETEKSRQQRILISRINYRNCYYGSTCK